jgi:hypothetical protein
MDVFWYNFMSLNQMSPTQFAFPFSNCLFIFVVIEEHP